MIDKYIDMFFVAFFAVIALISGSIFIIGLVCFTVSTLWD